MIELSCPWLGEVSYRDALALQHTTRDAVLAGEHPGVVYLLTHPPTITLGRRANPSHVLTPDGHDVVQTDRGGDVTWHGPGQLVGYPVLDLGLLRLGPRDFVLALAEALAAAVATFGVTARWDDDAPGLWVGSDKLAAFGLHVRRQVTTHGFALNVDPDLRAFERIVPCGLTSRGVTSLAHQTGRPPALHAVVDAIRNALEATLGVRLRGE